MERALAKNRIRRRGIFLLPNLFTTAALFAGFYAIVQAMNGRFDQSAVAISSALIGVNPWPAFQALIAIPYTLFDASSMASARVGWA